MWLLNQIDQTCCILRNLTTVHSQYTRVYGQKRFFCEHVRWERVFQCISICIFLLWAFFHVWRSFAFLFDISFILFFYFFFSFILKIVLFTLSSCLLFFPLLSFFFPFLLILLLLSLLFVPLLFLLLFPNFLTY